MIKANYIVYDTETGGLDKEKNPITQFACVVLDYKTLKEIDRWETFIKPYNDLIIEKEALEHTMVSMSDINNGISLKKFVKTASLFMDEHRGKTKIKEAGRLVPVGHNITFDNNMLDYAFNLEGKSLFDFVQPNFIDTMTLAKLTWGLLGNEKIRLSDCCERAKIRLTDAHGAMNDVEATADLFRFYMKRLRNNKSVGGEDTDSGKREKGQKFFEFSCGK
jgi:DNA polymerase III alpha subunit (gram-positive type)